MILDPFIGKNVGKCLLRKQIGKGAIGIVYLAHHLTLEIEVAVKLLRPQTSFFDESATQRLQREARAAGILEHRNVLKIFDVGQEDNIHYIVMEYIDGKSVEDFLQKQGALPIKKSIKVITQIADGLSVAHEANILHRDIKPANIMIQKKDEVVKLADFGLARLDIENEIKLTDAGSIVGTMGYTSPEQTKGNPSQLSDIYSLGITFFEMLTGELPYQGESAYVVMNRHANAPIPSAKALRPEIPTTVDNYIKKMMSKSPEDRPTSARQISEYLNEYLNRLRKNVENRTAEKNHSVSSLEPSKKKKSSKTKPMSISKRKDRAYHTKIRSVQTTDSNDPLNTQFPTEEKLNDARDLLASVSGTFEYAEKTVNRIWLVIVTLFLLCVASLTTTLAVLTYYQK